jgi:hypothetical protein
MSQQKQKLSMKNLNLLEMVSAGRILIWVDDKLNPENRAIMEAAERQGVSVLLAKSTTDALAKFDSLGDVKHYPQSHLRIISNMTRKEGEEYNTKAGLDFAQKIRKMQYVGPILIFCGNVDKAKQEMAQEHLVTITNETAVAQNYACFQQVKSHDF